MSVPVSSAITKLKNYSRNQNLTDSRALSVINDATMFLKSQLSLPGYEDEYTFDFFEDQNLYTLPAGCDDILWLRYSDDELNKSQRFSRRKGEYLFERIGTTGISTRLFGNYNSNGSNDILVLAPNSEPSLPIDSFDYDNDSNWIESNDATNVHDDLIGQKVGAGCLAFDVDVTLSGLNRATITKTITSADYSSYIDVGHFRCWYRQPTTYASSVSINWGSDASNYYKVTVTTRADGSAFIAGWNRLDFDWDGATEVGSPDASAITLVWFDVDYAGGATSDTDFGFDDLNLIVPDEMILTHTLTYVGESSTGTALDAFTATTDVFLFQDFDPSLVLLISLQASILLNPQILVDNAEYRETYKELLKLYKHKYPKKRTNNLLLDPTISKTTSSI